MKRDLLVIGGATERMLERFAESFTIHRAREIDDLGAYLAEHGGKIEAVATTGFDGIRPEVMDALPALKIISCYGVGYDAIDAVTAASRGIVVTHTPNVLNAEVADTAILLMLAVSRRLVRDDQWVRSGNWKAKGAAPLTRTVEGRRVGILGLGRIGETIAEKLKAFDCEVVYHSRNERPDVEWRYYGDLVAMARDIDFLVVITPGGAATRKLVSREVMEALGPEGTLINVARGSVVDEAEMVSALQEGRLGNAGLDVFENEPEVPEALFAMENVVLLPHVGSATVETRRAMGDLTVDNLNAFFANGKAISPVPECADL